jgi:hypothetical protein
MTEGGPVLAALRSLPALLASRTKPTVDDACVHGEVVIGPWRRLVFGHPRFADGTVDKNAYVFCVLEQFHRHLKHREIYAEGSGRWRDPQAQLLEGPAWASVKDAVLTALGLPEDRAATDAMLTGRARLLDEAYRDVAARLAEGANTDVTVGDDGRLHVAALKAIPEPPSLVDLRRRVRAMLPRVDLPELLLEVMGWVTGFMAAFTSLSGGRARLADLDVSVAACLTASALNIGYAPVAKQGVEALERARPVARHPDLPAHRDLLGCQRPADRQAGRDPLRPGARRRAGRSRRRDAVRCPDPQPVRPPQPEVFRAQPGRDVAERDQRPGVRVGRQGRVRDRPRFATHDRRAVQPRRRAASRGGGCRHRIVFRLGVWAGAPAGHGLSAGAGRPARPAAVAHRLRRRLRAVAGRHPRQDRPGQGRAALARHRAGARLDLHRGGVRLRRDPDAAARRPPTPLGDAIASYGRIYKSLHLLAVIDDEPYRRDIKAVRNLQEGRHSLAAKLFHGKKGELYQRYHKMECGGTSPAQP